MNVPNLTSGAARRLREAVDDAVDAGDVSKAEIKGAAASVGRAHPGWSTKLVGRAALVRVARRRGIDW